MHIVIIPSWYSNEKNIILGSFFKEQAIALQESGEEVTICYNEIFPIYDYRKLKYSFSKSIVFNREDNLDTYRYRGFNYLLHNHRRFKMFAERINKVIDRILSDKGKIDIFHFHSCYWAGICAPYIKDKFNIPYILTEHTGITYSNRIKQSYIKYIKSAYNNADRLISVSNFLKKEMLDIADNHIDVIPNFLDGKKFNMINDTMSEAEDRVIFFSLAFLVEGKGFKELIEACKILIDKGYEFILEIGGDGYLKDELEIKVREYGLSKYIKFLGILTRDEVIRTMNRCDVFILASSYETFGVVYIEAMACGKPVIGIKNGGAEEIIKDDTGIILDDNKKDSIAYAMEEMILNYQRYDKEFIREYFINNFEKSIIIDRLKDVYRTCLKK